MTDKAIEAALSALLNYPGCSISRITDGAMRAAIEAYEQALWQSIESAPKDGERVLLCYGGSVLDGFWNQAAQNWPQYMGLHPSYYRPLPPPPVTS